MSSYMVRRISADQVKTLLPPRTFMEMGSKAFSGAWSLLVEQKQRDFFTKNVKNGIIRDDIFWQDGANSIGPMVVLALYRELQDPILKKYGFKAEEFLDGVGSALERYHDVEKSIDNRLFDLLNGNNESKTVGSGECNTESHSNPRKETTYEAKTAGLSDDERSMMKELAKRETSILSMMLNQQEDEAKPANEKLLKILDWDWRDNLVEDLRPMVSDSYFKASRLDKLLSCIMLKKKGVDLQYQIGTSSVENVALLSARVKLVNENEEEADIDRIEHEELEMMEPNESNMSVAAQVEVLYDIEHSVLTVTEAPQSESNETKSGEFTERLVLVGVLEGFLKGGKDDGLQWRLSNIREPWEIPPVETSFAFRSDDK
mmetsp:Transcript_27284/g.41266  ORF Transcript_27284/g.41266 Transcript_27284/m.41266 type:complete len:374 (-) Transcript_27284:717-1838(-)|eukprot:CAMPEP_0178916412 /NCGR_PEP_ID=MMETSP0786-20121207/12623_1 /TAXON_ID=186022 /ORGANISM="Thalassionema frauenfeldii, Strain CCMP 1798" /LENGTH=373 /DNA_ID=CAMNT_0020589741 /DNA_START=102 /DNA_END=1223 /DNA_ORIENTATION=-